MKKLLCINNGYPSKRNPQFTTYIQTIENCLRRSGYDVELLVIKYNKNITPIYKMLKYILYWLKALFVDFSDYDIIYVNHIPFVWPILFNRTLNKSKVYVHWHGDDLVSKTCYIKWSLNLIRRHGTGFRHITPSHYFKRKLVEIMGYKADEIYVSPSGGINTLLFKPKSKTGCDKIVIGYSSGLMRSKGADVLYEIIKKKYEIEKLTNRQIFFKLINYGKEADSYITKFKEYESSIDIVEKLSKGKMPDFYQSIHILIMPSKGESLGLVALEAMGCGVPVVTHNLCAFPEFVLPGKSGELVDYCDDLNLRSSAFINAIIKTIDNYNNYHPEDVVVSNYSESSVVESYRTILE